MIGKNKNTSGNDTRTKVSTLIGEGTVFDGNLTSPEAVRLDGILNGNCKCEKQLIIGASGAIKGNISAQSVVISGKVDGDIAVKGKMELLSTGRVIGNITARSLVIDEDAFFDGKCTMTTSSSGTPAAAPAAKPAAEAASDNKAKKG